MGGENRKIIVWSLFIDRRTPRENLKQGFLERKKEHIRVTNLVARFNLIFSIPIPQFLPESVFLLVCSIKKKSAKIRYLFPSSYQFPIIIIREILKDRFENIETPHLLIEPCPEIEISKKIPFLDKNSLSPHGKKKKMNKFRQINSLNSISSKIC